MIRLSENKTRLLNTKQKTMYSLIFKLQERYGLDWSKNVKDSDQDYKKLKSLYDPNNPDNQKKKHVRKRKPKTHKTEGFDHYVAVLGTKVIADGSNLKALMDKGALDVTWPQIVTYRARRNAKKPKGIVIMKIGDCCEIGGK